MRRTIVLSAIVAALAALPAALVLPAAGASAAVRVVAPARAFRRQVNAIKRHTAIAVLLPDRVAIDTPRRHGIEVKWASEARSWEMSLGIGPRCGGANACFVGFFSATRGERPAFRRRVRLRGGRTGWFKPTTCGASCSPPQIQWLMGDVLYDVQFRESGRGSDRTKLVALANSALAAGPR
jgi:hypothetical protein